MTDRELSKSSTTEGLPVAPSLEPALSAARVPHHTTLVDLRVVQITLAAILIGLVGGVIAQVLMRLIGLITNLAF